MDSHGGTSSKGTSPDDKGKGYDQYAIFDGLLPRIETRGQSKNSSKKSSGKKKESKGSSQQSPGCVMDDQVLSTEKAFDFITVYLFRDSKSMAVLS
ncbi:hypothetical protein COL516b_009923 [Colletotrichum fioriniae]|nr:uncharacterized protein COL516b_009923 [Colletotrichum fioriniae]KAJ0298535.1 hypothetical protein COL516b_009923 [Colletotrichum fioriniae]